VGNRTKFSNLSAKLFLSLFLITCMITVLNSLGATFDKKIMGKMEKRVEATYMGENSGDGISIKEYEKIKENYDEWEISAAIELQLTARTESGARSLDSKVLLTDEGYKNFFPYINMIKGSFLDKASCREGMSEAVVSSELARKLYMTDNINGNSIILGNKSYKIVGVYEANRGILFDLTDDIYERIFIPYSSYETEKSIDYLVANGLKFKQGKVYSFEEVIDNSLRRRASSGFVIRDYNKYNVIIAQIEDILLFLLGLLCIIFLIRQIIMLIKKAVNFYKLKLRDAYLAELIRRNAILAISNIVMLISFVAVVVVIGRLIRFEFYIPDKYIPPENIFDIGFYIDQIKNSIKDSNSVFMINYVTFNALFQSSFRIALFIMVFIIMFFVDLIFSLRVTKDFKVPKTILYRCIIISIVFGLIIGYIAAYILGFSYSFPLTYIILMVCFLLLYNDAICDRVFEFILNCGNNKLKE